MPLPTLLSMGGMKVTMGPVPVPKIGPVAIGVPADPINCTAPSRGPGRVGVKVTSTVQVSPVSYAWLAPLVVLVPVPASEKSSPVAPGSARPCFPGCPR
jgi:hypothetical protein